jgi:citrate synthase
MSDEQAKLSIGGKDFGYDVLPGTVGPDVIDIRKLYGQTGAFTFDPGFTSTASCESQITYIDGDRAYCCIAATRSISWPNIRASWRWPTSC